MRPQKRLAQHWLKSEKALKEIITAADLKHEDIVLEIGPGTGVLTDQLLAITKTVIAIELDQALIKHLKEKFRKTENLVLLQGDFLKLDLNQIISETPNKVVANIPYNITGPILEKLLGSITQPQQRYEIIVLLVQKEIAERICAQSGSKTFGALSVRTQYLANCELIALVPAKAFSPPPKVDSAIIALTPRPFPLPVTSPKRLEQLVKLGFANRRKMLRNNLKGLISPDTLERILEKLEITPLARAEAIRVSDWVRLCNEVDQLIPSQK
ncbi:MAG: 16S rRNA (adenine(1518)-N(6)/adenine(1519)-N(6))-dimethyltransferase RsmA [Cyanobacteria bacterium]|jgi:16S rRNA (adenine1518-N6/adenine1519-N6)-dimethyltransferase|nr:16S rRNA (adenine(1518)-N(6)/adenine(1519)-N(6))-dimethyltransferase RsmA [Cyanobacteria bacterium GSL.Bin1]